MSSTVDGPFRAISVKVAAAATAVAPPNHSRRVSFDDMMQVRYFSRSAEEKVAMKKFSVMMRQQIRRRRRRSKLNISDSSDEGPDKITSTTLVATKTKFTSSRGDDDSISGMFADVVDEITDMISEVVIDARRAHERQQEERFFRDLEDGTISGSAIATTMSQGFLHSFGCSPSITSENDRNSSTTIPHNNKNSSSSIAATADDSSTTAHAMAHNIFQTIQNTASLRPTTITTTDTAHENPVNNAEEEDDEPWFCKAMRCGGKCGDL